MIGITMDYQPAGGLRGNEPDVKWPSHKIRCAYMQALHQAGAFAVGLSCIKEAVSEYVHKLDGLVITGGGFDVNPARYDAPVHEKTVLNPVRHDFEWELLDAFVKTGKPILGICAGMQLLNVYFGGSLIQHLPDLEHLGSHAGTAGELLHTVHVREGTRLGDITGAGTLHVNSIHHQGVERIGRDLIINAVCGEDGLIEGFEHPDHPFLIGVQWHPEYLLIPEELALWQAFAQAVRRQNEKR